MTDDTPTTDPKDGRFWRGLLWVMIGFPVLIIGGCAVLMVSYSGSASAPPPAVSKYTQTWTKGYDKTDCGDWNRVMTVQQRFAMSADVLTSARNKISGGKGMPSDVLILDFEKNISTACEADNSVKVLEIAYYVYNYDSTFKP